LATPFCGLNIHKKISATATGGAAQGNVTKVLTQNLDAAVRFIIKAVVIPTINAPITAIDA
jgi:hypothetical protein